MGGLEFSEFVWRTSILQIAKKTAIEYTETDADKYNQCVNGFSSSTTKD